MTAQEIIAKIRAGIERQHNLSNEKRGQARRTKDYYNEVAYGAEMGVCNRLLSFISYLEKSLPAKVADDDDKVLEIEAVGYCFDNGLNITPRVATDFARHFYDLGCRRTAEKYDEIEYNRQRAVESEKPTNQEGLEKEIKSFITELEYGATNLYRLMFGEEGNFDKFSWEDINAIIKDSAHYFYDLGCRRTAEKYDEIEYNRQRASSSSEIPKDLEEAAWGYASKECEKDAFIAGAKWDREQMMKGAVEMEVGLLSKFLPMLLVTEPMELKDFPAKHGDKVRVIIVKED